MRARFWRCYAILPGTQRARARTHAFQLPIPVHVHPNSLVSTRIRLAPVFDWLSVSGVGGGLQEAAASGI